MPRGMHGSGRLRPASNRPSASSRLQAQELLEQRALPGALHALDDELQVAPRLVHAQAPAHLHQFAIARRKVKQAGGAAEHGAADLAVASLIEK
jgi:hypothetical protein